MYVGALLFAGIAVLLVVVFVIFRQRQRRYEQGDDSDF